MVKLHTGRCKFVIDLVLMLWISWLVVNTSSFFTTKNNTENIQGVPGGMCETSGEYSLC
jgi:hypothetical protein